MNNKLKKVIFDYLIKEIKKVEIIYFNNSIWFIDRENRYWYFEYNKVDRHLWWRWSHFTQALKIFSMDAEKEQSIFGELVNMILTKKQKLESKYPNKIFKTVGSVMNFEDNDEDAQKNQIKTTDGYGWKPKPVVDSVLDLKNGGVYQDSIATDFRVNSALNNEVKTTKELNFPNGVAVDKVLNNEVKTTMLGEQRTQGLLDEVLNNEVKGISSSGRSFTFKVDEVLNNKVETTHSDVCGKSNLVDDALNYESKTIVSAEGSVAGRMYEVLNYEAEAITPTSIVTLRLVDEVLNYEVETTSEGHWPNQYTVDEALNCEVKTTVGATDYTIPSIDEVLNFTSKSIEQDWFKSSELIDEILGSETKIKSGELIEEHEIMDKVLEIQNIRPTERGVNDMVDFVLEVKDILTWDGEQNFKVNAALESTIEIEKIDFAKGSEVYEIERALNSVSSAENGTDHIMDFTLTDGSEIYPEEEIINKVLTQSPKLIEKQYDVDIVLNTLDIGANSIHYDVQSHEPLIDGILKKSYNL